MPFFGADQTLGVVESSNSSRAGVEPVGLFRESFEREQKHPGRETVKKQKETKRDMRSKGGHDQMVKTESGKELGLG